MKWRIDSYEAYPIFTLNPEDARIGPSLDLSAAEVEQINKAEEDFWEAQSMLAEKLKAAGMLDWRGHLKKDQE